MTNPTHTPRFPSYGFNAELIDDVRVLASELQRQLVSVTYKDPSHMTRRELELEVRRLNAMLFLKLTASREPQSDASAERLDEAPDWTGRFAHHSPHSGQHISDRAG